MSILCMKFEFALQEIGFLVFTLLTILVVYPLLILTLVPLCIYRYLVSCFARRNDSKVGNILSGTTGVLAGRDPYSKPIAVLLPYLHLVDKLDIPQVVKILQERVIKPEYYPELKQKIVNKFGYHFWYPVDNFNVEDHVHYVYPQSPYKPVNRTELWEHLTNTVTKLPFNPDLSPWEILVVPNFVDELDPEVKSFVVLRVNHCLMDGYSVLNFYQKCSMNPDKWFGELESKMNHKKVDGKWTKFWKFLLVILTGPYFTYKSLLFPIDWNKYIKNTFQNDFDDKWNGKCATNIPADRMRNIKASNGVSMSSLITTIVAHVSHKSMKRAELPTPKRMHAFLPYPLPNHGDILTNHWSLARIPIEVDLDKPANTLEFVDKQFNYLKSSPSSIIFTFVNELLAVVPSYLRYVPEFITPSTLILTNMPCPKQLVDVFGCEIRFAGLSGKTSKGFAFVFCCVGYNGNFHIDCGGPKCNLPNQTDADYLAECVMETLNEFEGKIDCGEPENILKPDLKLGISE